MTRQVIELPKARIEVDERPGYVYIVESGQLADVSEVQAYIREMEAVIASSGTKRALIDARNEIGEPPLDVRQAMWKWLLDGSRGFELVAFILGSEMAVARVNMTSLSQRAPVRAFDNMHQAQRWLVRGPRASTQQGFSAVTSSVPPRRQSSFPPASDLVSAPTRSTGEHVLGERVATDDESDGSRVA